MRPRRKLTEEQARHLVTTSGALAALQSHPSWENLKGEIGVKEEKCRRVIMAMAMNPNKPVDQRQIDYLRGFIGGMHYIVAVPESAESTLENYLKEQGISEGSA